MIPGRTLQGSVQDGENRRSRDYTMEFEMTPIPIDAGQIDIDGEDQIWRGSLFERLFFQYSVEDVSGK